MAEFIIPKYIYEDTLTHETTVVTMTVDRTQFAPGIFAGSEGLVLNIYGHQWIIEHIDLENRKVTLKRNT